MSQLLDKVEGRNLLNSRKVEAILDPLYDLDIGQLHTTTGFHNWHPRHLLVCWQAPDY